MTAARAVPLAILGGLVATLFVLLAERGGANAMLLLSSLPVFLVGLSLGTAPAAIAVMAGIAATVTMGGAAFGAMFVAQVAMPVLVLVPLVMTAPQPPMVARPALGLAGLGSAMFLVAFVSLLGHGGLEDAMRQGIDAALKEAGQQWDLSSLGPPEEIARKYAFWLPGAAIALWLLIVAGNAVLAQGALARFGWNLRPAPAMADLALPRWVSILFGMALAALCFGSGQVAFLGANLAEILAVPLTLGGLAVVHAATRRYPAQLMMLIGIYVFVFVFMWPIALIVAIGVIEQWVGLRRRFPAVPRRGDK